MSALATLSLWYRDYAEGRLARGDFEGRAFRHLARNRHYFCPFVCEQDRWLDFLSWMYPRMRRAIIQYSEQGVGFGTYLSAVVRWGAREFLLTERRRTLTERVCWEARAGEMEVHSEEAAYLVDTPPPRRENAVFTPGYGSGAALAAACTGRGALWRGLPARRPERRRLEARGGIERGAFECRLQTPGISRFQVLVLLLRSYMFVSEDFLSRIAKSVGMERAEILRLVNEIRRLRRKHDEKMHSLREAAHSGFYRCLVFQQRLARAFPSDSGYRLLQEKLARAQARLAAVKDRLSRKGKNATYTEIAQVLGVTKGIVGGAMRAVRILTGEIPQKGEEEKGK